MVVRVVSIGYERRSVIDFINILNKHKVKMLIDVRELPLSRCKGFSKTALKSNLEKAGVKYKHIKSAGNPYRKQKKSIQDCLKLYRGYLKHHPEILDLLSEELKYSGVAFLCYERKHANCHRSVLLDAIVKKSKTIKILEVE